MPNCFPNYHEVASLGTGPFDFGSAPQITPINDPNSPEDGTTGNTSVAVTFPQTGQIGIGAAVGISAGGSSWAPSQTLFAGQGNRASASLTKVFSIPNLLQLAPSAVTASCSVLLPSCNFGLLVGDQYDPAGPGEMVYICGQATIDVVAFNFISRIFGKDLSKSVSTGVELFTELGIGANTYGNPSSGNIPNILWNTQASSLDSFDPLGITQNMAYDLSASMGGLPATADHLAVTISVEVSAWTLPSDFSFAVIDATGQNTGLPILSVPVLPPAYNGRTDSSVNTQPIQINNLRVCGI